MAVSVAATAATFRSCETTVPPASTSRVEIRPSPNVVLAIRDLAHLETASFHMERVVEMTDTQTQAWGLIDTRDVLLLVAVGDVTAGVDLGKLDDADVSTNWAKKSVRVKLSPVEVFTATLDNEKTHVYTRETGVLATRREDLEGLARRDAERTMRSGAIDGGILTRAQTNAERTVRSLLRTLGFEDVQISWKK